MIRRLARAVAFGLAVGATLATTTSIRPAQAQTVTDLAIIGDSLISRTMPSYHYGQIRASGGRGAYIPGADGQTARQVADTIIPTILPGGWLVMEIGINDIAQGVSAAEFATFVTDVVYDLPNDRCLAWVLPWGIEYQGVARSYVAPITSALRLQPCHALIGWVPNQTGMRVSDGVHLTAAGGDRLAAMIYAATGVG